MPHIEFHEERGASVVEYALLVALIFVVCVIAVQMVGTGTEGSFSRSASHIGSATD